MSLLLNTAERGQGKDDLCLPQKENKSEALYSRCPSIQDPTRAKSDGLFMG